jgi:hypothetical protein
MAGRLLEESWPVRDGTSLGVLGGENEASHAGCTDSADAHRARLESHEKHRSNQPFVAKRCRCRTKHQYFRMRGWIVPFENPIAVAREHGPVGRDQHGSDGHLTSCARRVGLREGNRHEFFVRHRALATGPSAQYALCRKDEA